MTSIESVGIDVSAQSLCVHVGGTTAEFRNDAAGHQALIKELTRKGRGARVCLEATGSYSLDLALALQAADRIEVMVLNPRVAKSFGASLTTRNKTDKVDAKVLCDYATRMPFIPWQPPSAQQLELRAITRRLHRLVALTTEEKNRLHAASATETSDIVAEDVRLHIEHLELRIAALRKKAIAHIRGCNELSRKLDLICSITGFGEVSAVQMLGEIAALPTGLNVRQWVAQAGLDPRQHESGSSVKRPARISRMGNRYLRAPLYMPALVATQHQPQVRAFYQALLKRNKKPLQALVAVMRKLLHAIYGVLTTNTPFDGKKLFPAIEA